MIGLIDVDSKIPNLALMKISAYYKGLGERVEFIQRRQRYEKVYASCVFTRNSPECEKVLQIYPDAEIGGTGWDMSKRLSKEIESAKADYDLYGIDYGLGFTTRGCIRNCEFCFVPAKEGKLHQDRSIADIVNPKSNVIVLLDNNFTADPLMIEKCKEINDMGLIVNLCQGVDARLMTDEKAYWMGRIKHEKRIHIAWDYMKYEDQVWKGVENMLKYIKAWRITCYMLVGFDTTFDEDMYRFKKLTDRGIDPYVMTYNDRNDKRLKHFERWVNARIYKSCKWEDYQPYKQWLALKDQIELVI